MRFPSTSLAGLAGRAAVVAAAGSLALGAFVPSTVLATTASGVVPSTDPSAAVYQDTSLPLVDIVPVPDPGEALSPEHPTPAPKSSGPDPVVQSAQGVATAPGLITNFLGVGRGFKGPQGKFTVNSAPPDTDGDVGPNHYVQIVNTSIAVFSKTGVPLYGPVPTKTVFKGFVSPCGVTNDGDGIVKYDKAADRWIITQFSISTQLNFQCVAVSTTPDPTGSYYRYAFRYNASFNDYGKLGVWSDAYYITFNMFNFFPASGAEACAYDRAKMLLGQKATQQCYILNNPNTIYNLLPSDLDGSTPPPAGAPNYVLHIDTGKLQLWKFHVDWVVPAHSKFSGPISTPVAAFSPACVGGPICIPQPGTTQKLDSLGDRLMYRLAYRNFGDHESLVVNHSVVAGTSVGVRWYEVRQPGTTPVVYQQGTYAPDSSYRWMGSMAQDHAGNIALGYSLASKTIFPGIRFTGHLTTDPLGEMGQGEGAIVDGAGSQNGNLDRWGDYTAMAVDPTDDCTFWYTNQYLTQTGSFNWSTRIASFKFPSCS